MTIYLYKKTHNKTGLKYLGKTKRKDPYKYKGSGIYWLKHIKVHGYDVTTEILKECQNAEEVKEWGLYYSNLWNVVDEKDQNGNKTWANLKSEEGDGGDTFSGRKHRNDTRELMKVKAAARPAPTEETKKKISVIKTGVKILNKKPRTKEHQEAITKSLKGKLAWNKGIHGYKNSSKQVTCPHCGITGGSGGVKRFHFNNCRHKN